MSNLKSLTGYIASLTSLIVMVLYPVVFIAIIKTKGLFRWTNVNDMVAYENKGSNFYKYAAFGLMILYSCAYCVITLCLKTEGRTTLFADISALFGLAFCVCVSAAYFVQLTAARFAINSGSIQGLEQLTQSNPASVINAVIILGWTLFFPLSTLALSFLFDSTAAGIWCRIFCFMNSLFMFTALGAYIAENTILLMITMYPALGLSTIGLAACLIAYFKL